MAASSARRLVLLPVLFALGASAQGRAEVEAVRGRAAWLAAAGAVLATGGGVLVGVGVGERGRTNDAAAVVRGTHELIGGVALLVFGTHVGLLAMVGAIWPLRAVVVPLPGGGGGLLMAGSWP